MSPRWLLAVFLVAGLSSTYPPAGAVGLPVSWK
jgi:hypothetical protein